MTIYYLCNKNLIKSNIINVFNFNFINKDNMGDQTQNTIASNLNNESSSEEDDSVKNK